MNSKDSSQKLVFNNFVHFRRLKELFKTLCRQEGKISGHYDLSNIRCYQSIGDNFKAPNVRTKTRDGSSIFVSDNKYYIAEVANTRNRKDSLNGNFLFIAYNRDYDYWLFGEWNVRKDSKDKGYYTESVCIIPYGVYKFSLMTFETHILKTEEGRNIDFGAHVYKYKIFDFFEARKEAFKKNLGELTAKKRNQTYNKEKIFSENKVKIYKKKYKK